MPRGELWLPEELKILFRVVQDSCDLDILMSSRHANAVEWEPIALEMVRYGFRRTWQQCRAKWKALRRAFHLENEYKILHGTHSDKKPPSYSIMLKMWQKAGRPVFREQHMLRTRNTHPQATLYYRERSNSFCSISHAPVEGVCGEEDAIRTIVLNQEMCSPGSHADTSSLVCPALESGPLDEEEDVKPVILHHIPETPSSDAGSSSDKCQELQLLEKLVMQQKEIINRLDYLNHNLVQMASLHYQHMAENATDPLKTGSQDSAFAGNQSLPFPPMFIPFPTPMSANASAYTTYIPAPQPAATYTGYSQSPNSCMSSFQIPAEYIPSSQPAATHIPSSQPATTYIPSSQPAAPYIPSSLPATTYIPSSQPAATYIPSSQPAASYSPSSQPASMFIPSSQSADAYLPSAHIPSALYFSPSKNASSLLPASCSTSASSPPSPRHAPSKSLIGKHRNKLR